MVRCEIFSDFRQFKTRVYTDLFFKLNIVCFYNYIIEVMKDQVYYITGK